MKEFCRLGLNGTSERPESFYLKAEKEASRSPPPSFLHILGQKPLERGGEY
jgi:hypothetical protein